MLINNKVDIAAIRERWTTYVVPDLGTIHHEPLMQAIQDIHALLHVIKLVARDETPDGWHLRCKNCCHRIVVAEKDYEPKPKKCPKCGGAMLIRRRVLKGKEIK